MDVNSVRWLNYSQDESAARKAFSRLKASALGGPGKLELRYDGETGDWLVVLYNIICGTSESLENAYGIPACPNADSWFPYEGATKVDNYAGASTVEDAFKVPMTIDGLRKAAKEMAGQYYSCRPDVMCPDEAMRRLRSGEAKKTERATGTMRQRAHTSADDTDSCSQIRFKCKHCGKTLVVKESLAGQRGKCPECQQVLTIPKPTASEGAIQRDSVEEIDIDALAASVLDTPDESSNRNRVEWGRKQPQASIIKILCPSCSTAYSVSDAAVGKKANCKACGATFSVKRPVAETQNITSDVQIKEDWPKKGKSFGEMPKPDKRVVVLTDEEMTLVEKYGYEGLEEAASAFVKAERFQEAFQCTLILTKTHPEQARFWRNCGIFLYSVDESVWRLGIPGLTPYLSAQKAIEYLAKATELDRSDHLAWYYEGFCLGQIGYFQEDKAMMKRGLKCFDQALRTRPGDPSTKQAKAKFEMALATM
jgi:transposase-like protein